MLCAVLQVSGFYSDLLHQPWLCATVELQPHWLEVDNIDRCVNSNTVTQSHKTQGSGQVHPSKSCGDSPHDWQRWQQVMRGLAALAAAQRLHAFVTKNDSVDE